MLVSELIQHLQTLEPNADICINPPLYESFYPLIFQGMLTVGISTDRKHLYIFTGSTSYNPSYRTRTICGTPTKPPRPMSDLERYANRPDFS